MTDEVYVDLIPDELSLARGQLASGLPGMAEGVLRRHVARLEAGGRGADDELDVARGLLAEALWRQGRPRAAGAIVDAIRAGSLERRRPQVLLVEAEAMPDIAANSLSIAFGDFKRGYLIVDRQGVNVLRDPYSAKPYVLFYTTKRVGGGVQNFDAIKLLKFAAS